MPLDDEVCATVVAIELHAIAVLLLLDLESSVPVLAGKEVPANQSIQARRSVASGDEDALPVLAVAFPFDGDAVGGILGGQAKYRRQPAQADLLQPNQAHTPPTAA